MGYETRARQEERALVRRMLDGDATAMSAFADGYSPSLYRFARSRLRGNTDLARDIVQTTLCKTLSKLSSYRGEAPLFTWLCAACRNEIAMHFRHSHRFSEQQLYHEEATDAAPFVPRQEGPSPEQETARREAAANVHHALDLLPPHYAQALEWKYLDELPVVEIANRLGLGQKAAESLLTRARGAFREVFDRLERQPARPSNVLHPAKEAADHERPARARI